MTVPCDHRWVPAEGHRGHYYCSECSATGARSLELPCAPVKPHRRPHPELRPSDVPEAQPAGSQSGPHFVNTGRIPPKPRPA